MSLFVLYGTVPAWQGWVLLGRANFAHVARPELYVSPTLRPPD